MTPTNPEADAAFWKFHARNPGVLELFLRFAREAKAARIRRPGAPRIGAKAIWERIRWEYSVVEEIDSSAFVLNNNYVSRYARLAMMKEPSLAGMFETRKLKPQPQPVTY